MWKKEGGNYLVDDAYLDTSELQNAVILAQQQRQQQKQPPPGGPSLFGASAGGSSADEHEVKIKIIKDQLYELQMQLLVRESMMP